MAGPRRQAPVQVPAQQYEKWLSTLSAQHGVLDISQLRGFGVTWAAVRAQILAGRWQAVLPRVYATFSGPLPREARVAAALLYAGPASVLSHRTAAELWGMRPESPGPVHVTVPYQCSAISQPPLVVVHRSRAFGNIAVDSRPPLTSRADTALDLAVAEPSPREAQLLLAELMTGRRVAVEQVRRRLIERQPRRYKLELDQAVALVRAGVESMLEERFAVDVEVAHGLPAARRQAPFRVDGRKLFEDAVYDDLGVPLTVRLDGRRHLEPDVALRDRRRDNAAELAGRSRLVFGWTEVSGRPCVVATEVATVLHRHGWQGPLRRCPKCPGQDL
ncbi:MAG TPA: hypothetical protein VK735_13420 [Pseudonocardia sp.]|jgi:hypothetical protein|uniref:hypothetical protein n=1 Tax=Pseudonocardia sp. TaxID=60912 RepID=UPI002B9A3ED9|nr:hypothetical protein [Pseudonocardia sp.]HTF48443.1 hypothetical protein [Pseudonocardia sp.]